VSDFAEILRKKMFEKRLKAVDLAKGTNIAPSVISRYLSGQNQPSRDNIITIGNYLDTHPQSLLSSSDAPESIQKNQGESSSPLLKQIEDKIKIIELLEQMVADKGKQIAWLSQSCDALADEVRRLEAQIGMLKAQNDQWMASSEARHPKGREKTKNPTTPHKQMVEYLKKHKPKK